MFVNFEPVKVVLESIMLKHRGVDYSNLSLCVILLIERLVMVESVSLIEKIGPFSFKLAMFEWEIAKESPDSILIREFI